MSNTKKSTTRSTIYWALFWLTAACAAFAFFMLGIYLGRIAERALKYEGPQADCQRELLYTKLQLDAAKLVAAQLKDANKRTGELK